MNPPVEGPSFANEAGEVFNVGDSVAKLPDAGADFKRHGVVQAVLYGKFHVAVDWEDYALLDVHIDRITHRP